MVLAIGVGKRWHGLSAGGLADVSKGDGGNIAIWPLGGLSVC